MKTYNEDQDSEKLILVDCDGTFNDHEVVRDFVDAIMMDGTYRVQLVSNECDANQNAVKIWGLKRHKDENYYGDVLSKAEFSGKLVFTIVDDDPSSHTINAQIQIHPTNTKVLKTLTQGLKEGPTVTILSDRVPLGSLPSPPMLH